MILKFRNLDGHWRMYGDFEYMVFKKGLTLHARKDEKKNKIPYFMEPDREVEHEHWDVGDFDVDAPPTRQHAIVSARMIGAEKIRTFIFAGSGFILNDSGKTIEHLN